MRLSRSWHRWGAWSVGLVVLLWTVTGIVMVLPGAPPREGGTGVPGALSDDLLSPYTALDRATGGKVPPVQRLELRSLAGRPVYVVAAAGLVAPLIDARSGEPVVIDDSLAARLARGAAGAGARVVRIHRPGQGAPPSAGSLPATRVVLAANDASKEVVVHVASDGRITLGAPGQRFKGIMGRLHTFSIPRITDPRPTLRRALLIGTSVVTLALIVTGFVLLLPARRRTTADA